MMIVDLFNLRILTPKRIIRLLAHVMRNGIQLSNVIHMCDDKSRIALRHNSEAVTYDELFRLVGSVSGYLHATCNIRQGSNALVIADNSIPSVVLLLALSALGCNIHIIRAMKDYGQFRGTVNLSDYDSVFSAVEEKLDYHDQVAVHSLYPAWQQVVRHKPYKPFVRRITRLAIFTSGTTGFAKSAGRSNTLCQYLNAIADVVKTVRLQEWNSVILPVPIYHSYGLSTLFLGLMLNKPLVLVNKFNPVEIAEVIRINGVEAAVLVPQMLNRILPEDVSSLRCIISCADVLPTSVLENARKKFGDIIYNLYGTSEAGLATIATPEMLAVSPSTIGKPVKGCELRLIEEEGNNILYVKSRFAIVRSLVRTGDIASVDERGWYYIQGRADQMIVVNGINIYPAELLQMAYAHEDVQYAGVKVFLDENDFRRIRMMLLPKQGTLLEERAFKDWWVSRYGTTHLPAMIDVNTNDSDIKLMGG